jgi:NACHT domain
MLEKLRDLHNSLNFLNAIRKDDVESLQASLADLSLKSFKTNIRELNNAGNALREVEELLVHIKDAFGQYSKEEILLRSLQHKGMTARYESIVGAHGETFKWVFGDCQFPSTDLRSKVTFADWLRKGDRIYWVSGKPGSGKSTLMKYLSRHRKTEEMLSEWCKGGRLVLADFYFWIGGTEVQRSQRGLMQQLLFDIVRYCPDLIPLLFNLDAPTEDGGLQLSINELQASFRKISNLSRQIERETYFCFFIDGLDEYSGDHHELIKCIQQLAESPCVKICVSSRPWNCFQDAFGHDESRRLYMQDLTREDIAKYARDHLRNMINSNSYSFYRHIAEQLIAEVVSRAQGVFLWVFLVMRSLKEGFINADNPELLYQRLLELPTDLEGFFKRIVLTVDRVYRRVMHATFQVMIAASEPLPLLVFPFIYQESVLAKLLHAQHSSPTLKTTFLEEFMKLAERQLNGRFKGLIEIQSYDIQPTVQFFHRTVQDYLATRDMQDLFIQELGMDFKATHAGCDALLSSVIAWHTPFLHRIFEQFMNFASEAQRQGHPVNNGVIDRFKELLEAHDSVTALEFQVKAIEVTLTEYIRHMLSRQTLILRSRGPLYLNVAVEVYAACSDRLQILNCHNLITLLLSHEVDANIIPASLLRKPGNEEFLHIYGSIRR